MISFLVTQRFIETVLKTEESLEVEEESYKKSVGTVQAQPENEDCKAKAGALVGEVQKALPTICSNLSNYTFNFNFS